MFIFIVKVSISVADPGFPRGGCGNCKGGDANLLFLPIFPQNCMKLKKFGPGGSVPDPPPPGSANVYYFQRNGILLFPIDIYIASLHGYQSYKDPYRTNDMGGINQNNPSDNGR